MVVYYRPADCLKIGFIVSRKVDKKAVIRNRLKRMLREIFRHYKPINIGEFIVIAKQNMKTMTYQTIEQEWLKLTQQEGCSC